MPLSETSIAHYEPARLLHGNRDRHRFNGRRYVANAMKYVPRLPSFIEWLDATTARTRHVKSPSAMWNLAGLSPQLDH